MRLTNELTELLGIDFPIIQAPMGGEATPAMAIAVSNAGGLGGMGCSYMSTQEIGQKAAEIRAGTSNAFNLNFFAHPDPRPNRETDDDTRARLEPYYAELGLRDKPASGIAPCDSFTAERLQLMLDIRPDVVSFHFGLPPLDMVRALQDIGVTVMCSATTVAEAVWLDASGVDVIIAQGWEAGGHRGNFEVTCEDFGIGTMALVPQIVDAVNKPVVASGGIADGRGIAASITLGAMGVQLGTAFLSCPEANISDKWRKALGNARDEDTRLTRAFSGRPARAKNNRYIESMARVRSEYPDFPTMYGFSDPLEQTSSEGLNDDFDFFLYGQAAALNRNLPAGDLVRLLAQETWDILGGRAG